MAGGRNGPGPYMRALLLAWGLLRADGFAIKSTIWKMAKQHDNTRKIALQAPSAPIFGQFIASRQPNTDDFPAAWAASAEAEGLRVAGVLNLRNTTKQYPPHVSKHINAAGWATLHEPLAPGEALTARQFARCARFADECRARGGVVVVHCTNGVHRTGAFCVR